MKCRKIGLKKTFSLILSLCLFLVNIVYFNGINESCYAAGNESNSSVSEQADSLLDEVQGENLFTDEFWNSFGKNISFVNEKSNFSSSVDCGSFKISKMPNDTIAINRLTTGEHQKVVVVPKAFILNKDGKFSFPKGEITFNGNFLVSSEKEDGKICPVTDILDYAFANCIGVNEIVLPEFIKAIGKSSFSSCVLLKKINLPNYIKCIEESAFEFCFKLKEVVLPKSLENIGPRAFSGCKSLEKVFTSPSFLKKIGKKAFNNCVSLKSFFMPYKVVCIEDYAFFGCISLVEISWPGSIKFVGVGAFLRCLRLSFIYYAERPTYQFLREILKKNIFSNYENKIIVCRYDPVDLELYEKGILHFK
ncbi:MAG: leucine-rich repeat domain-containing protein [Oscillospiraceae bacterium]|jgi:hypothetical protein|nr:leucine-rich repeat domain-containing protein [Oscillospiraceae bacterium]